MKILIVEDEFLTVRQLKKTLESFNFDVIGDALSVKEALNILENKTTDLVLLDVNLKGDKDGIHLANIINEKFKIPYVFLTAYSSPKIMDRAMSASPGAYLIKPFTKEELYIAIEIALAKTSEKIQEEVLDIKHNDTFVRLKMEDILFIESERNYVKIYTDKKIYRHRSSMKEIGKKLPKLNFARVHRSYYVNITKVNKFSSDTLFINEMEVPVSRSYKNNISDKFQ